MNQQLVFTIIAKDQPGIVTTLSDIVNQHSGNWLDSRMSQLAGEFAGIVHIDIPVDQRNSLEKALTALSSQNIDITLRQADNKLHSSDYKLHQIEIVGNDRPGIVAELSKLFSEKGINILEFDTNIHDASMAGGMLFHADAVVSVNQTVNLDSLQDKLHELADALALDIQWTSRI